MADLGDHRSDRVGSTDRPASVDTDLDRKADELAETLDRLERGRRVNRSLIIVLIVASFLTAVFVQRLYDQRQDDLKTAVIFNCRSNQAQDSVLRAILVTSINDDRPPSRDERIRLEHTYERVIGKTAADKTVHQMRVELVEDLMGPLGGVKADRRELQAQCAARLRAAGLTD